MKIVRFLGGLGNQMFQYAFYKSLSHHFKKVKADLSYYNYCSDHNGFELGDIFDIELDYASDFELKLYSKQKWKYKKIRQLLFIGEPYIEEEEQYTFNGEHYNDKLSRIYQGYWQHYRYVECVADILLDKFVFQELTSQRNLEILRDIKSREESVAIHVRRGDYARYPLLDGIADKSYFLRAIALIKEKYITPKFYVFSDDILWCREHLDLQEVTFIDWNKGTNSYIDMQLMSNCKHAIISNSTFSWWAAWLNRNVAKTVIVPKTWYRSPNGVNTSDMHPKEWIRI